MVLFPFVLSLKASKQALLAHMPDSKARAMSADDLFTACTIPSRTTGQHALRELLSAGKIQRIGKGARGSSFRYFTTGPQPGTVKALKEANEKRAEKKNSRR